MRKTVKLFLAVSGFIAVMLFFASCTPEERANAAARKIISEMSDEEIYRRMCEASEYDYLLEKYDNITERTKATAAGQELTSYHTSERYIVDYNRVFIQKIYEKGDEFGYWYDIEIPYHSVFTDDKQYDKDIPKSFITYDERNIIVSKSAEYGKLIVTMLMYIPEDELTDYCTAHEILYCGDGKVYIEYRLDPETFETQMYYYTYKAVGNEMIYKKTDIEYNSVNTGEADAVYDDVRRRVFDGKTHTVTVILDPDTAYEKRSEKEICDGVYAYIRLPEEYNGPFYSDSSCTEILNAASVENQLSLGSFTAYVKKQAAS